jgi:hypothetical protein
LAVLVVTLLAASASFLTNLLFSRAPFLIVRCVVEAADFLTLLPPRPRPVGITALMIGEVMFDIVSTAAPATSDACVITSPATFVV